MRRVLLIVLVLPALATAQSTNPAPTIQVTSRIVYVDVTVRDTAGNVVHGLTQNDFHVFEDGKPQQIDYFTEHVYNPAVPVAKPASSLVFSNTSTPAQDNAVTVLLFDLLNTSTPDQLVARKQMLKFLGELPSGRRFSLFTLTDKLQMIQSFTGSPELLADAAKMLKPVNLEQMPSIEEVERDKDTATEFDREGAPPGHVLPAPTAVDHSVQSQDTNLDLRTRSTIAALGQLAHMMNKYEGRKNLFWVSESFPVALNITHNCLGQTIPVDAFRLTNVFADARIAVYPISVLGLYTEVAPVTTPLKCPPLGFDFMGRGILKSVMNGIADQTGGQAIFSTNDLADAMRRNLDDGANYYTLAYQPQNKKWNKQFRNIRVELAQTGDSLAYRRGYFAYPDTGPAESPTQVLNAALQPETPESTALGLQARIDISDPSHGKPLVHSVLNASNLSLVTGSDGHLRGQIVVRLVAFKDAPGVAPSQPNAPLQSSGVLNLDFDPAQYLAIGTNGIAFTQQLILPPGHYRLRLGVSDVVSNRVGTLDMPVSVPVQAAKN